MLYSLRQKLNYWRFDRAIAAVFDTPPLRIVDSPLRIVSMVAVERDLPMYLLAAKVLYRRIGHGRLVVLPDGPLPESWKARLQRHFDGAVEFLPVAGIPVGRCQRGGTWERLLACLDLSERHYVVQMDADTLALGDIPEVRAAIAANRAFTLAEGIPIQTLGEAAAWMANVPSPRHVIDIAQLGFARHPDRERLRYIRGSSGFTGFAQGAITRSLVEEFHVVMEELVGVKRWREWGTEQVASNFAVANSPDPLLLPYPDYCTVTAATDLSRVRFGHFIGSYRFYRQRFARAGAWLVRSCLLSKSS